MSYNDFFDRALSAAYRKAPMTDDETFMNIVKERARNMTKTIKDDNPAVVKAMPKRKEEHKARRILGTAAGTAAVAAVIGGSVLGLNYIRVNGALKERPNDVSIAAGYHAEPETYTDDERSSANETIGITAVTDISDNSTETTVIETATASDEADAAEEAITSSVNEDAVPAETVDPAAESEKETESDTTAADDTSAVPESYSPYTFTGSRLQGLLERSSMYDFSKPNFTFPINSFIPDDIQHDEQRALWYFYDYNVQPVCAPFDGTIVENRYDRHGLGKLVTVKGEYGECWEIFSLGEVTVQAGDTIKQGDIIGSTSDNSFDPDTLYLDEKGLSRVGFSIYWDLKPGQIMPGAVEGDEALEKLKEYAGGDYHYPVPESYDTVTYYVIRDRFNLSAGSETKEGDPIYAAAGGTVVDTNEEVVPGYGPGKYITVQAADGRKWQYSHCSEIYADVGDTVAAGDMIAAVSATGWCTGACLAIDFPE